MSRADRALFLFGYAVSCLCLAAGVDRLFSGQTFYGSVLMILSLLVSTGLRAWLNSGREKA
jgi:hypothetical protein